MTTCVVIGAGISGCVLARMLAEREQTVHVYEQTGSVGGMLKTLHDVTLDISDQVALKWLMQQVPLMPVGEKHMVPRRGYVALCEHLLQHKGISLMKHAQIIDVLAARRYANHLISTASPDVLVGMRFGELPWRDGRPVRNPMTLVAYQQYATLLAREGIQWCGSLASFELLPIPRIIRQCMNVCDAIVAPMTTPLPVTR